MAMVGARYRTRRSRRHRLDRRCPARQARPRWRCSDGSTIRSVPLARSWPSSTPSSTGRTHRADHRRNRPARPDQSRRRLAPRRCCVRGRDPGLRARNIVKEIVDRGRPPAYLTDVLVHGYPTDPRNTGYPSSHTAVAVAVVVGAWPWLNGPWRVCGVVADDDRPEPHVRRCSLPPRHRRWRRRRPHRRRDRARRSGMVGAEGSDLSQRQNSLCRVMRGRGRARSGSSRCPSRKPGPTTGRTSGIVSSRELRVERSARREHAELVVVGIGHDDPIDVALADVDARRPERDEPVDLRSLIAVGRRRDVEMEPVLAELRLQRAATPGDHRTGAGPARGSRSRRPDPRPAASRAPRSRSIRPRRVPSHVIDPRRPQSARKLLSAR